MRTQAYTVRIQPVVSGKFVVRFKNTVKKVAKPKSMPAVTATWPSRLNQPVNQLQAPGVVLGQLGRPVVQPAGGRVGRGDLGHAQADDRAS